LKLFVEIVELFFLCSSGGLKYSKAVEWKIPVVGIQWLNDVILGDFNALKLPVQAVYQLQNNQITQHSGGSFYVDSSRVSHLLGWLVLFSLPGNQLIFYYMTL
jgi:twin BRCT domain